jgi:serine/threonine-protein kinase
MDFALHEGDLIAGKYRVERVLGDGGMGVVVAARHLELGERVALKFLLPEAAQNPEARLRFVREARAAVRIKGEHVARVFDVGTREDGTPFIVMEYLEGHDLGRLVEAHGALAVENAVHYVLQACEAVAQAHAVGIVHRDLKPANLFLTTSPDGSPLVKVLDFGISKSMSVFARTLSPDITTLNAAVGTPQYMSPEQARDAGNVDARTDVWGLGAILYELLAGKAAFDGDSVPAIVMMIATEEPAALESSSPDLPAPLAAVVRRCLQKNRDDRFANVAELARALAPFAPEEAAGSVARIARILGHDSVPPPTSVDTAPGVRDGRLRGLLVALAGAVVISLVGAIALSKRLAPPPLAASAVERPLDATPTRSEPKAPSPSREVAPTAPESTPTSDSVKNHDASSKVAPATARTRAPARARSFDASAASGAHALANEPATLTFQANVPAEVALDGRSLGQTPKSVRASPGDHTVVFAHPELGERSHAVTLAPGEDRTIRATFEPRTAN